jgi:hypothetical protein
MRLLRLRLLQRATAQGADCHTVNSMQLSALACIRARQQLLRCQARPKLAPLHERT